MASRTGVFSSSVGTKIAIGLTGVLLFLYLLIHIAGNLIVFLGPAAFNTYAFTLESNPLLPLVSSCCCRGSSSTSTRPCGCTWETRARGRWRTPKKKSAGHTTRKTFASSTMIVSGLWLLAFLVIHVKAFHDGWGNEYDGPRAAAISIARRWRRSRTR
jgi:succinate dehydrogenase / fumarate reductase cytochrome b subunit